MRLTVTVIIRLIASRWPYNTSFLHPCITLSEQRMVSETYKAAGRSPVKIVRQVIRWQILSVLNIQVSFVWRHLRPKFAVCGCTINYFKSYLLEGCKHYSGITCSMAWHEFHHRRDGHLIAQSTRFEALVASQPVGGNRELGVVQNITRYIRKAHATRASWRPFKSSTFPLTILLNTPCYFVTTSDCLFPFL